MALALYRKYRPATFAEVAGQEHVTQPLRTALAAGRINHAYLFSGPRGCGKTSSARIMARSLNCVEGPTSDPCGECNSCRALAPEGPGTVDVTELDAASHGGVDDARELRDRAFYAPAESRYRVFIIDEAHMVSPQGFNALLKIVEEPPDHLIFIFATTEPDKVLPTIRSRTHHYPFRLIPPSAMRELLERNVAAEGVEVEPAVFPLVIRAGGGSARDTQSVLDQLLAGAGPEGVTYERAVSLLGVTDVALIDAIVDALAAGDAKSVFVTIDGLAEAGHDPRRFATDLLDRLRDLILLQSVPDAASSGMVSAPGEQLERMAGQAQRLKPGTLTRYAEILHRGLLEMRGATAPRLLLELLCARMLLPEVSDDEGSMLQRLEGLERRVTAGGAAPSAARPGPAQPSPAQPSPVESSTAQPTSSSPVESSTAQPTPSGPAASGAAHIGAAQSPGPSAAPSQRVYQRPSRRAAPTEQPAEQAPHTPGHASRPKPSAPPPQAGPAAMISGSATGSAPGRVDAAAMRQYWPQVLAAVRKLSRSTEALLTGAAVHEVDGSMVVLTHTAEPLVRRLSEQRNIECIATALGQVISGEWQVRCVHAGAAQAQAASPSRTNPSPRQEEPAPTQSGPESRSGHQQQGTYQRPSATGRRPRSAPTTAEPDIPLPPEPEEDPYAPTAEGDPGGAAAASDAEPEVVDLEARAHKLLSDHLGARPLD